MAKKKKQTRRPSSQAPLDPVLSRGVIAIVLIVFAIITALSLFGQAAEVGEFIEFMFGALFGYARYTVPVILLIFAWFVVRNAEHTYKSTHKFGAFLFFLSVSSMFHMVYAPEAMWLEALAGNGGGIFGMGAWPLKTYLGTIASYVLLGGIVWISILLIFNTAITHFLMLQEQILIGLESLGKGLKEIFASLFVSRAAKGDEAYIDDEDEEEDELYIDPITKRQFGVPASQGHSSTHDADDADEEDASDTPVAVPTPTIARSIGASSPAPTERGIDQADYMNNIIIKKIPPTSLLSSVRSNPTSGDIKANTEVIQNTFRDFNIQVDMGKVRVGPTVTQYTLKPPSGVKLTRITSLSNNLALALAAHPIRIEAPIPGKSLVGIEVPNEKAAQVTLKELLESKEFKSREHNMMVALGRDVAGKVWFADLPKMPHLLIAGSTGSGKTVCMNTIIMSLLYQNTAETLRFIMVDPKRVELTPYNGIPHLLAPVITDVPKTVNALKWCIGEMDRRFEMLSKVGNREINTYNAAHPDKKLPHIVFIIDELADLMQMASNEVEAGIIRLAQMARAVGIHLILATQRPSVDVITGLMKANIPGRIAFSVASSTDSRTILDSIGAESLLGKGDMLLSTANLSKPVRIQGAFMSEQEAKNVIDYLRVDNTDGMYDQSILEKKDGQGSGTGNMFGGPTDERDALFNEAKAIVLESGKGSASYIQRRLRVGYARAARLLDELEMAGIVGPADGAKPREILATEEDIELTMNSGAELNVFKKPTHVPPPQPRPATIEEEAAEVLDEEPFGEDTSAEVDERYPDADDDLDDATTPETDTASPEEESVYDESSDDEGEYDMISADDDLLDDTDTLEQDTDDETPEDTSSIPRPPRRELFR
jgi:S-DNA-T family DNA segregation ATPase FtsK/SpoIIIE